MLYVGHFSFLGPDPSDGTDYPETGWFTLFAEADSVDEAGDKFRDLIDDHADDESFEHVTDVFVESIVEVRKLPERGVLAQMQIIEPGGGSLTPPSLPGVSEEFCVAYTIGPEPETEDENVDTEPFVSFRP